jgi:hypothetical protein
MTPTNPGEGVEGVMETVNARIGAENRSAHPARNKIDFGCRQTGIGKPLLKT